MTYALRKKLLLVVVMVCSASALKADSGTAAPLSLEELRASIFQETAQTYPAPPEVTPKPELRHDMGPCGGNTFCMWASCQCHVMCHDQGDVASFECWEAYGEYICTCNNWY